MSTVSRLIKRAELPREDDTLTHEELYLANYDLLPIPVENRTWGPWTCEIFDPFGHERFNILDADFLFWFAEGSSITSLTTVGTAVKNGLVSGYRAISSQKLTRSYVVLVGGLAGRHFQPCHNCVLHDTDWSRRRCISYPVPSDCQNQLWAVGKLFPTHLPSDHDYYLDRCSVCIYVSISRPNRDLFLQFRGNCFYVMLHAIFPSIAHVHNPFSSQVTMTGGRLIGFACGWVVTLACCWVPFHKFQKLVVVKSAAMLFFILAFFIWVLVRARGGGAMLTAPSTIPKGETHAWLYVSQFMIQASNQLTFATNNADITRYASRPKNALWTQIAGYPMGTGLVAFFGVFIVSASQAIYGKVLWDPIAILDGFLTQTYDSKTRCGVFFLGLGFSFAQVTTMIFANLISAGNDTAALVPRFISVKRGAIICMILAFAITPWNLTKTSFAFTSYLNRYDHLTI